jgi:hypothetical protein
MEVDMENAKGKAVIFGESLWYDLKIDHALSYQRSPN